MFTSWFDHRNMEWSVIEHDSGTLLTQVVPVPTLKFCMLCLLIESLCTRGLINKCNWHTCVSIEKMRTIAVKYGVLGLPISVMLGRGHKVPNCSTGETRSQMLGLKSDWTNWTQRKCWGMNWTDQKYWGVMMWKLQCLLARIFVIVETGLWLVI